MIDTVYKILLTLLNKENNGYVSPTEFNLLAYKVQEEIISEYFDGENRDKNRENKGLTNKGYSNLDFHQRQKITSFAEITVLSKDDSGKINLPSDLYFIEDDGVNVYYPESRRDGAIIEEVERNSIAYLSKSSVAPTMMFPVYEKYNKYLITYPENIESIKMRYIRKAKKPVWTYSVVMNKEMFDPSNSSYQDFELHTSEFNNIVTRMLSHFGITIREFEITQIAENLKNQTTTLENN